MDTYKLNLLDWTKLQNRIFRALCMNAGKRINQRALARECKASPTAISKSLKLLEKQEAINIKKEPKINLTYIELNLEDRRVIKIKQTENLRMVYESNLDEFLEEKFAGATIILFGSYSKGEDDYKSDIDIAVIGRKEKEIDLLHFEKFLKKNITINFYNSLNEIHKNLRENILNGIILAGGVEL